MQCKLVEEVRELHRLNIANVENQNGDIFIFGL
jgi:hypothetical protein